MSDNYKVVRQQSFRSQAIDRIRNAIISGSLAPGSMHSEMTIAKILGISRTPVREALLQLAHEGLVEFIPHRGVQIAEFDRAYLSNMFQLRAAIESFCVDQLAANPASDVIKALKAELKRQSKLTSVNATSEWTNANMDFHLLIVQSANNSLIDAVIQPIVTHAVRFGLYAKTRNAHMHQFYLEHCGMVEAIERGDRPLARKLAADHLLRASALMEKLVDGFRVESDEKVTKPSGNAREAKVPRAPAKKAGRRRSLVSGRL